MTYTQDRQPKTVDKQLERVYVAGKGKLSGLEGQPLLVDTNDPELDRALSGYRRVVTGYHDAVLYPVAAMPENGGETRHEPGDETGET